MTCLTIGIPRLTELRESTDSVSGRGFFKSRPIHGWPPKYRHEMRLGNQTCHQRLRLWSNSRALLFYSVSVLPIPDQIPVAALFPHTMNLNSTEGGLNAPVHRPDHNVVSNCL